MLKSNRILVLICMAFMIRWGSTSPSSRYVSESETGDRYWPVMDEVLHRTPHGHEHSAPADAQKNVEDDTSRDEQTLLQVDGDGNVIQVLEDAEVQEDTEVQVEVDPPEHEKYRNAQKTHAPVCDPVTTCNGQGTCQPDNTCICNEGFKGKDCSITRCNPYTTCNGQGTCQPDDTCKCNQGYRGTDCSSQLPVEDMYTTVEDDSYEVASEETYKVAHHAYVAPCDPVVTCSGLGSCLSYGGCKCYKGYTGKDCSTPVCHPDTTCNGRGFCTAYGGCICKKGFKGIDCSTSICHPVTTCKGRGTCQADETCKCNKGLAGKDCSIPVCHPDTTCSGQGFCTMYGGCICKKGFKGTDCSKIQKFKKVAIGGNVKADNVVISPLLLNFAKQFLKTKAAFLRNFVNLDDGKLGANLALSIGGGHSARTGQIYLNPFNLIPGAGLSAVAGGLVGGPLGAIKGFKAGFAKGRGAAGALGGIGGLGLLDVLGGIPGIFDGAAQGYPGGDILGYPGEDLDLIDFDSRVFLKVTGPEEQEKKQKLVPYPLHDHNIEKEIEINIGNDYNDDDDNGEPTNAIVPAYLPVRVGHSAENEIVVDPRSSQLFFITVGKNTDDVDSDKAPENQVLVDGNGNLVQIDSDLKDSEVRVGQSAEDEIVVDPRSGQLLLLLAGHKAAKAIHLATKGLRPLVYVKSFLKGAALTAIPAAAVGKTAGLKAGALKKLVEPRTGSNFQVDPRSGQTLPTPVVWAAQKVLITGARLAPYAAIPLAVVGGTLGAKALLLKKLKKLILPFALAGLGSGTSYPIFLPEEPMEEEPMEEEPEEEEPEEEEPEEEPMEEPLQAAMEEPLQAPMEEPLQAFAAHGGAYGGRGIDIDGGFEFNLGTGVYRPKHGKYKNVQKTYGNVRAGQSAGDEVVIDPRTGQLILKKAVLAGKKIVKKLGLKLRGGLRDEIEADPRTGTIFLKKSILLNLLNLSGSLRIVTNSHHNKVKEVEINIGNDDHDDDEAPKTVVLIDGDGNVVHVDSDLENTQVRVGQSAEDEIVVDPRTGQLLLKKIVHKGKKVVGPLVALKALAALKAGRFKLSALDGVGGSGNLVSLNTGLHNTQLPVVNLVDLNTAFDGAQLSIDGSGNLVNVNTGLDDSRVGQNGNLVFEDFQADARTGQSYHARASRF